MQTSFTNGLNGAFHMTCLREFSGSDTFSFYLWKDCFHFFSDESTVLEKQFQQVIDPPPPLPLSTQNPPNNMLSSVDPTTRNFHAITVKLWCAKSKDISQEHRTVSFKICLSFRYNWCQTSVSSKNDNFRHFSGKKYSLKKI